MIGNIGGLLTNVVMISKELLFIGILSIVYYTSIIKTPRCRRHFCFWPQVQTYVVDTEDRALCSKTSLQQNRKALFFFLTRFYPD